MMAKKYVRPKNWYPETVERLITKDLPPLLGPLTADSAWRYIYAIVMWPENANGVPYLHLQESDKLENAAGRAFSARAADYLRQNLSGLGPCNPFAVVDQLGNADVADRLAKGFPRPKKRDPNVTGTAFETAIQVLINHLCGVLPARTPELNTLQGFELAPVGYHSKPDLALFDERNFRLLISTKWTLRKERIGTYLHEAFFYRQRRPDLQVAFVVSEFNMNILNWLSQDPLADRVYHVNKAMLLHLTDPLLGISSEKLSREVVATDDYRRWLNVSERVFDLSALFSDVELLKK